MLGWGQAGKKGKQRRLQLEGKVQERRKADFG